MPSDFRLSVCPHDTANNLLSWYVFNSYLQRKLGVGIHFAPQESFLVERRQVLEERFHLVYANPYSALRFAEERGFMPVARPLGVVDEVIVVARAGAEVPPQPLVASATDKLVIHELGLQVLRQLAVNAASARFLFTGNHLTAARAVVEGKADLGFVFNETWACMTQVSRSELRVVGESTGGVAFHCFMVGPEWGDKRPQVQQVLCGMHREAAGQRVLADLRFQEFVPIGADALLPLSMIPLRPV